VSAGSYNVTWVLEDAGTIIYWLLGTATAIASTVAVAADSTLVVITKDSAIYVLENQSMGIFASASGDAVFTCSWDEIS